MAAQRGDAEVVRKCLAEGVAVDARVSRWKRTALGQAAGGGHTEVVKLLLAAGADVNAGDVDGQTPLHHAVSEGCLEDVELLIEAGANVNAKDRNGTTPLYCCGFIEGKGFHKGVLDALLEAGVEVEEVRHLLKRVSPGFNRAYDPKTGEFWDYGLAQVQGGASADGPNAGTSVESTPATIKPGQTLRLFDSETLAGWRVTDEEDFELHGPVGVEGGALVLGEGRAFTGVTWAGEFPREGYEVSLEARRREGQDIFCGLTFPVGDAHATLVVGGWSNNVVGVSNVDGLNASENDWVRVMRFEDRRWYAVRLRVTPAKIEAWIDGERVIDLERAGHV
ncbi:MAG: ankyrin repeat domain-containing protein, partial [Planctomycetota bacterium]